jgi:branched-chain amino acid transport system permease protein
VSRADTDTHGAGERRRSRHLPPVVLRSGSALLPAVAVIAVQLVVFPVPLAVWLQGLVLGLLNAVVVLGLVLVHRANRVVNFAQASIGALPATLAGAIVLFGAPSAGALLGLGAATAVVVAVGAATVLRTPVAIAIPAGVIAGGLAAAGLRLAAGHGWIGGLAVGLVTAVLCGLFIDAVVISRFRHAPRLVVTVATIGLAQLFAVGALLLPRLWGNVALLDPDGLRTGFETPLDWSVTVGGTVFRSAELLSVLMAVVAIAAISLFLRRSDLGIAVRAAAERGDRASMLGVPVPRLEAMVWIIASVLAFLASYLQAGILGLELSGGVGLRVMVAALGAMTLGGFASLPAMLTSAIAIGVL